MDAQQAELEGRLEELLKQASAVATELQSREQGSGVPHFDQIETAAHDVGQRVSRMIQTERVRDVAADVPDQMRCPDCGRVCSVRTENRDVLSVDGHIELTENVAECGHCRHSFFSGT